MRSQQQARDDATYHATQLIDALQDSSLDRTSGLIEVVRRYVKNDEPDDEVMNQVMIYLKGNC